MVIVDAIKSASTEHAVFFLVTAYLESLQHTTSRVPDYIVRLPVRGERDLCERMSLLERAAGVAPEAVYPVTEASIVLRSALERLRRAHCSREKR